MGMSNSGMPMQELFSGFKEAMTFIEFDNSKQVFIFRGNRLPLGMISISGSVASKEVKL